MRLNSSCIDVSEADLIAGLHGTYGDVIFCELVVEVVYADFASVA